MDGTSLDLTEDLINQLKAIIPTAFTEGKLDVEKLKTLIGEEVISKGERYELNWPGKADAYKVLQRTTTETLVPNPEDSINWDKTENVFIEGENLAVLKVLQKSYYGKIKMIYIDPPYNTGSDSFIYPDKFSETREEYAQRVGDKDEEGYMMKEGMFRKNSKDSGHYHSNWLNMMLPRLHLARNLLADDGLIFVSIGDDEQANLRILLDQVFGENNFLGNIIWKKKTNGNNQGHIPPVHDYIFVYSKMKDYLVEEEFGFPKTQDYLAKKYSNPDNDPRGPWDTMDLSANHEGPYFPITNPETGEIHYPADGRYWVFNEKEVLRRIGNGRIIFGKTGTSKPVQKVFQKDRKDRRKKAETWWDKHGLNSDGTSELSDLFGKAKIFTHSKPSKLLKNIVNISTQKEDDIALDFFSGTGTLGHAILELNEEDGGNRKFICVQLSEKTDEKSEAFKAGYQTISAIAEARIKKVIEKVEQERSGKLALEERQVLGFRKFTLQDSNFKTWRGDVTDVEELKQQMQLFVTPQREGVLTENILWELLVKNGKLLTENLIEHKVEGGMVWSIEDGSIAFALDVWNASVTDKLLEVKPQKVIALDSVFNKDDAKKSNAQLQCEDAGIAFTTV